MILVLMLPNGECHINNYRLSNGNYRTICAKTIERDAQTNTLTADNTFPGTCKNCKAHYDEMYLDDLECAPEMAHSISTINLHQTLDNARQGLIGPDIGYYDIENRNWWRLNKYKKLVRKSVSKPKKNKFKFK